MKRSVRPDHPTLAAALERRVLKGPGETPPDVRQAVALRAAGGPAAEGPYDDLARQIGESPHCVTDAQVASVLAVTGSEKATFEVITAAAVGAGLMRWRQAMKVLEEAPDAPA